MFYALPMRIQLHLFSMWELEQGAKRRVQRISILEEVQLFFCGCLGELEFQSNLLSNRLHLLVDSEADVSLQRNRINRGHQHRGRITGSFSLGTAIHHFRRRAVVVFRWWNR